MHSVEEVREALRYDEELGRFFWNKPGRGKQLGQMAGSFDAHGYGQINFDGTVYKEHRLAWAFIHGEWPTGQIDHVNHDRRDNRPENLREVDNTENHRNRPIQSNNSTGVVGVSFYKGAYVAYINTGGSRRHLGRFKKIEEAAHARDVAMKELSFHENHGVDAARPKPHVLREMLDLLGIHTPAGQIPLTELKGIRETYRAKLQELQKV